MPIIDVKNLSKSFKIYKKEPGLSGALKSLFSRKYEDKMAVNDVSFTIEEGELIGFIGPNGAGKTTTLKMLSGLLYPSSGSVSVLDQTPFDRKKDFLKQISLVMGQKNQLWWDLPAMDTFLLNKEIYEISDTDFKERVEELSELLDVKEIMHVQVRKLSLGQRMKCELMAALLHRPKILFLDEPTIGLDVVVQEKLRDFIKDYNLKYKATILLTSHYMRDVKHLCKRVVVINYGEIIYDGDLDRLMTEYAKKNDRDVDDVIRRFFQHKQKKV
ncbi:MAG: ABC transporter ATP-binding protein [Microgenomates group bacterium]|jgi:ABC-2 type transport system ATP-binding protein|nr:ABC transporter ATP-binding protein [Candidatus Woesebacteria bacterium]QQR64151.1 MAG: ABC transporter ATP-binding protein [Candidatus Roizmanbacteria bacterium]